MRRTLAACALSLVGAVSGCGSTPTEEGDSSQALFVQSSKIWPSHTIYVCFLPTVAPPLIEPFHPGDLLVRDAVESTWGSETGVTFKGWSLCDTSDTQPGIRIQVGDFWPKTTALGSDLGQVTVSGRTVSYPKRMLLNYDMASYVAKPEEQKAGMKPFANCAGRNDFCTRATAVHEFGHALGFDHEQNTTGSGTKPAGCAADSLIQGDTSYLNTFDQESVLDYCSTAWNNDGNLTALDIAGASLYYGGPRSIATAIFGNHISAFYRGKDGTYYNEWHEPGGGGWKRESLGAASVLTSDPAAVAWTANDGVQKMDVYGRGTDGQLWGNRWSADSHAWSGWFPLGGLVIGSAAAVSWGQGAINIFVRGTDNNIYNQSWDDGAQTWSGWSGPLPGGAITGTPAVGSFATGRLDVAARMSDGTLGHMRWDGSSWTFDSLPGGKIYGSPTVTADGNSVGRLHVYARDTNNHIVHIAESSFSGDWAWEVWADTDGGPLVASSPTAVTWGFDRYDLFIHGFDDTLYHWQRQLFMLPPDPGSWETTGGKLYGTPGVVTQPSFLEPFFRSTSGGLHSQWRNPTQGQSSWSSETAFGGDFN
ncbi:MAG TPA: hypothetical protein VFH68_01380 [Polyangia bacterium]|jgi:hypothetical protein|nr:hypothetical protein [Polyangia bacterium]